MEQFIGQLILDDEIDYEAAREHILDSIRKYIDNRAYSYYTKEFRQSYEWKNKNLAEKLAFVLDVEKDIDSFIAYLIENDYE